MQQKDVADVRLTGEATGLCKSKDERSINTYCAHRSRLVHFFNQVDL